MRINPRGALARTLRGCHYLPGYGHHPGNATLIALACVAGVSGAQGGLAVIGGRALAMVLLLLPVYLFGAHSRGRDAEFHPWWQRQQAEAEAARARREAAARPRRLP